ncbi:MAG TPA: hypothetical protein VNF29_02750, partial [Candidatus Binataceae bacterium]|nr:hypothetical protein [Candidatus Binataceae bacterium]
SGEISKRGDEMHRAWSAARAATLVGGSEPTLRIGAATALARSNAMAGQALADPDGGAIHIEIEQVARDRSRPRLRLFGTLVHETMLRVRFAATRGEIAQIVSSVGRMIGAGSDDVEAAIGAVAGALGSATIRAAAGAAEIRREYPILVTLDDGVTAEGVADLAFRAKTEADGAPRWTIVEFKTDADLSAHLAEYRAQVAIYLRAIRAATASPASGVILWI